jgi:hypothetical protein
MAKAVFHKHQQVFVKPVGTWAVIEKVKPQWVKDMAEPIKVYYDCGLGRDFSENELAAEQTDNADTGQWRLLRARNKWQSPEECSHHPFPGSFPIVVTEETNWGGWRVPGAEYDRNPQRIEAQARIIANAPRLLGIAEALSRLVAESPDSGSELVSLARRASDTVRVIRARPPEGAAEPDATADAPPFGSGGFSRRTTA